MYIPNRYQGKDKKEAIAFIERFNFGVIVSVENGKPIATHLPFSVTKKDDELLLTTHMAKANHQWESFENNEVLVIFSEPHAYISPGFYNKKQNVPTWNYLAVHAYGAVRTIPDLTEKEKVLKRMMEDYEPKYKEQWSGLSEEYKTALMQAIVAFEVKVTELQFQEKLSQNKKDNERKNIVDAFSKSDDDNLKLIAEYMAKKKK